MVDPRKTVAKLTERLQETFGEELRSVVLFGSVTRGEAMPGISDLNVLVLLDSMAAPDLIRAMPLVQQWIRDGNTPPHLYAWDEWPGMRDTFAIEIADMQDSREVLWGVDPIAHADVTAYDLRLHTEREVREMLLHLRLRLVLAASSPHDVGSLLMAGLPSMAAYLRAVLRLAGDTPGTDTPSVIERGAAAIGSDADTLLRCWEARRTQASLPVPITDALVERYTAFARDLILHLDRMRPPVAPLEGASNAYPLQGVSPGMTP